MKRISLLILMIMCAAGFALGQTAVEKPQVTGSPLDGTWRAVIAKSQRDPNHHFESLTINFATSGDAVVLTYAGVNRAGKQEGSTRTLYPDGKERSIREAPGYVEATRWLSPTALESVGKKDGKEAGRSTYELSQDSKVLTAKVKGIDAKGRSFEQVIVFERGVFRDKQFPQNQR
jgi:hypothetical protein